MDIEHIPSTYRSKYWTRFLLSLYIYT